MGVWNLEELTFYIKNHIIHSKVLEINGEIKGIVNAAVVDFSAKGKVALLAIMENYNYEHLSLDDQKLLIRALLCDLKQADVAFATDFAIGYSSPQAISDNKFVKYVRKMSLYLIPVFNPNDALVQKLKKSCKTTYVDIR